jgi:hypothetical protein
MTTARMPGFWPAVLMLAMLGATIAPPPPGEPEEDDGEPDAMPPDEKESQE